MDADNAQTLIVIIQILMGIISLIGGAMLMALQNQIKDLKEADGKLGDKIDQADQKIAANLKEYARHSDVQEWRREQKDDINRWREEQTKMFNRLFEKIDDLQEKIANKADRQ